MTSPFRPGVFDPLAAGYDDVAQSTLGVHYRNRVAAVIDRHVGPGARVLDIGCGTGIDAARLSAAGHRVVAIDASGEMVVRTRSRGVADVYQRDLDTLPAADPRPHGSEGPEGLDGAGEGTDAVVDQVGDAALAGPFDLVLANFGVVNCSRDLPRFGRWLVANLDPDGVAVLVTMAPVCPPELLQGVVTGNGALLRRRRRSRQAADGTATAFGDPYAGMPVRYHSAGRLVAALGGGLELVDARAIGVALPTFEQRRVVQNRPRLLRALGLVDRLLGSPAVGLAMGDHHIAVVGRRRVVPTAATAGDGSGS
ncbi:MAG: methyltransferase domain-containing protein [Actinomycetota bacterium]